MKKIVAILLTLLTMGLIFTGCGEGNASSTASDVVSKEESSSNPSSQEIQSEIEEPELGAVNPFTGMPVEDESSLLNRPLAVMVNNVQPALPQRGISDADIIYELPVEGAITRLMAVFADYKAMPDIGSIRSARHDYVELLKPFNPLYLHFGGSTKGKEAISQYEIDNIDGIKYANLAFYQDEERAKTVAREHTYFSNLSLLEKGIVKNEYQTTRSEPLKPLFQFAKPEENIMEAETTANSAEQTVSVKLSSGCTATFTYNAQTGLYEKGQYGKPHLDETYNKAAAVTNVLVMYTDVGLVPNTINKEIDLSKGTGYYISKGKAIQVTFKKDSVDELLKAYRLDNSEEIIMNAGKTWVCIAPNDFANDIQF